MPTGLLTLREDGQELRRHDQDGIHREISKFGPQLSFPTRPSIPLHKIQETTPNDLSGDFSGYGIIYMYIILIATLFFSSFNFHKIWKKDSKSTLLILTLMPAIATLLLISDSSFYYGLVLFVLWFFIGFIGLVLCRGDRIDNNYRYYAQIIYISVAFNLLIVSYPLISSKRIDENKIKTNSCMINDKYNNVLLEQMKMLRVEIQQRISKEDEWYRYKFAITGGLLTAFVSALAFLGVKNTATDNTVQSLKDPVIKLLGSRGTCLVIAVACFASILIDMHNRLNIHIINQTGIYISEQIESGLQQHGVSNKLWETFLREGGHLHDDKTFSFLFFPHLNYQTTSLYIIFSIMLLASSKSNYYAPQSLSENLALVCAFALIQFALFAFGLISNLVPRGFDFRLPTAISFDGVPGKCITEIIFLSLLVFINAIQYRDVWTLLTHTKGNVVAGFKHGTKANNKQDKSTKSREEETCLFKNLSILKHADNCQSWYEQIMPDSTDWTHAETLRNYLNRYFIARKYGYITLANMLLQEALSSASSYWALYPVLCLINGDIDEYQVISTANVNQEIELVCFYLGLEFAHSSNPDYDKAYYYLSIAAKGHSDESSCANNLRNVIGAYRKKSVTTQNEEPQKDAEYQDNEVPQKNEEPQENAQHRDNVEPQENEEPQ